MTFKEVIVKNFLGQLHKYIAYFLSCTFCIIFFFIYATLFFHGNLKESNANEILSYVMPISMVCIFFFSIFFISYAHSSFIEGRNTEFGVYLTLGMHQRDLCRLVRYENVIIAMASIVSGIGIGALFSRLFQMLVTDILGIKPVGFYLDYRSFLGTIVLFVIIFVINIARSTRKLKNRDIKTMLMEARKSQGRKKGSSNAVLGILGIVLMLGSVVALIYLCSKPKLLENPIFLIAYMIVAFSGLYLAIAFGGNFILYAIKKSRFYLKNLLSITEIHYRYRQNQTIIFVLSILITVTIFIVASPYSLLEITENIATKVGRAAHVDYCVMDAAKEQVKETFDQMFESSVIKNESDIPFCVMEVTKTKTQVPVISLTSYNQKMGTAYSLMENECLNMLLTWVPGNGGVKIKDTITLTDGTNEYGFLATYSERGDFIGCSFPNIQLIVVSDSAYEKMASKLSVKSCGSYHIVFFHNWKWLKDETILFSNQVNNQVLGVKSVALTYEDLKNGYSAFFFICGMLGILFFVASGSVLYFKQYTELPETKRTFYKLYKIGISNKEADKMIGKQLLVVFFVPLVCGSFLGLSLIYLMTHIAGGQESIRPFMKNASLVVGVYFIFQTVFYWITKKKYQKELTCYIFHPTFGKIEE